MSPRRWQIARALQRWDLVAEAATALTGAGVWSWREFGTTDETMINALEECLTRLPDGPLAARVLACLQMENYYGRRVAEADAYGRRSVQMARETGDPLVLLQVLLVRGLATYAPGTHEERLAMAEEMLTLPLPGESEVSVLWQYGSALQQAARSDEAEMIMERCQTVADRLRHTGADIPLAWWWFMIAVKSDAPDRRQIGEAALDLHRRSTVVAMDELVGIFAVRSAEPGTPVPVDVVSRARSSLSAGYRALIAYAMVEAGDVEEHCRSWAPMPPRRRGTMARWPRIACGRASTRPLGNSPSFANRCAGSCRGVAMSSPTAPLIIWARSTSSSRSAWSPSVIMIGPGRTRWRPWSCATGSATCPGPGEPATLLTALR